MAFLHRHELARRNELLRNIDDAEQALARKRAPRHNVTVVLDNLRSAENVGSIFRTADAARGAGRDLRLHHDTTRSQAREDGVRCNQLGAV